MPPSRWGIVRRRRRPRRRRGIRARRGPRGNRDLRRSRWSGAGRFPREKHCGAARDVRVAVRFVFRETRSPSTVWSRVRRGTRNRMRWSTVFPAVAPCRPPSSACVTVCGGLPEVRFQSGAIGVLGVFEDVRVGPPGRLLEWRAGWADLSGAGTAGTGSCTCCLSESGCLPPFRIQTAP